MRDKKSGKFEKELADPELMSFYVEYYHRDFLREQALKKSTTMSAVLRNLLDHFIKVITEPLK